MRIFSSALELKEYLLMQKCSIGFVPTMGALHNGHLELIKKAKSENELVVVSIFVNPTQFLQGEDFDNYPRKDEADKQICSLAGVDMLFMPQISDMYKRDEPTILAPKIRGFILEGESRAGHFNGVLSVVMKLLNIVSPTNAYFGKKDAQQLFLIQQMVSDFFMSVNIVAVDTIRDKDGLALSSRNAYLDHAQRALALKIPSSLRVATTMIIQGILETKTIIKAMREELDNLEIVYVCIVDRAFRELQNIEVGNSIILVEAKVGSTRLLDNIWI